MDRTYLHEYLSILGIIMPDNIISQLLTLFYNSMLFAYCLADLVRRYQGILNYVDKVSFVSITDISFIIDLNFTLEQCLIRQYRMVV